MQTTNMVWEILLLAEQNPRSDTSLCGVIVISAYVRLLYKLKQWTTPLKEAASLLWDFYRDPLPSLNDLRQKT